MKIPRITSAVILSLLIGVSPAFAQHEQQGEKQGKPEQQHAQQPQQHAQQQRAQQPQQHTQQQRAQDAHAQHAQMQRSPEQRHSQQVQQRGAWQEHRARSFESEHRSWQQRGGYHGYRVPDYEFRAHFGRGHFFRVYGMPFLIEGGFPRFQYGGYWFSVVDPYPEYWGPTWYQTDDVYVDYVNGGYYLFNRRHPGRPGVAISISL